MAKKIILIVLLLTTLILAPLYLIEARQGCCSWHGGVCGCQCCDGTPLSSTCAPYYPQCNSTHPIFDPIDETPNKPGLIDLDKLHEQFSEKRQTVKISEVIDGDTIKTSTGEKIRLIGIDTPETKDPRKPVQCFGEEASNYLESLIEGREVQLEEDSIGDTIDKYDRLLRYIYSQNENINAKMIKDGYSYAYTNYPFSMSDEYKKLENEAREAKRGLWAENTCNGEREMLINEEKLSWWQRILKFIFN